MGGERAGARAHRGQEPGWGPGGGAREEGVVDAAPGLEIIARKLKEDVEFATRRPSRGRSCHLCNCGLSIGVDTGGKLR